jgi:hypothetical protein
LRIAPEGVEECVSGFPAAGFPSRHFSPLPSLSCEQSRASAVFGREKNRFRRKSEEQIGNRKLPPEFENSDWKIKFPIGFRNFRLEKRFSNRTAKT